MGIFRKGTIEVTSPEPAPIDLGQSKIVEPLWLKIARTEIGTAEVSGPKANPKIVEYASFTTLHATSDEVPWCSSFTCWCLEKAGLKSTRSAAAGSYLQYGIELLRPRLGCIVVFKREGGHHVGFYLGETYGTSTRIDCLSGNSNNQVRIASYPKKLVLGYRWPTELDRR